MPTPNVIFSNPFAQQNPLNKPLVAPKPPKQTPPNYGKPANFGNVSVDTKNPILVQPIKPSPAEVTQETDDKKVGFWASKTKKQKALIIGGTLAVVVAIVFLVKKK